jgi:GNAT superfamily N-acetyltransferase
MQRRWEESYTAPLTIRPANEASWEDLTAIFGTHGGDGSAYQCQCQKFKTPGRPWFEESKSPVALAKRARALFEQTRCGHPEASSTTGLVAYRDGEPVGWCAVEPRSAFSRLGRAPWAGRSEDSADPSVWAVPCFVTRKGFRRQRVSYALCRAAVDFARERGARALEGYPMITEPGREITWGELHVGSHRIFVAAGFTEVSRPSLRRVVMRREF